MVKCLGIVKSASRPIKKPKPIERKKEFAKEALLGKLIWKSIETAPELEKNRQRPLEDVGPEKQQRRHKCHKHNKLRLPINSRAAEEADCFAPFFGPLCPRYPQAWMWLAAFFTGMPQELPGRLLARLPR